MFNLFKKRPKPPRYFKYESHWEIGKDGTFYTKIENNKLYYWGTKDTSWREEKHACGKEALKVIIDDVDYIEMSEEEISWELIR